MGFFFVKLNFNYILYIYRMLYIIPRRRYIMTTITYLDNPMSTIAHTIDIDGSTHNNPFVIG